MLNDNQKEKPDNIVHDNSDGNPAAYKTEFAYTTEELERLGDPIAYFRLVAFRDKDGDIGMASDQFVNDENASDFEAAVVSMMVKNPGVLAQFQKYVNRAEAFAKMRDGDFIGAMRTIMGRPGREFAPGGRMPGMDALRRFLSDDEPVIPSRRRSGGLSSILESLGGKRVGGLEIHVVGIGGKPGDLGDIENLADLLRKATGGAGCDCAECTAERERVARAKETGTDKQKDAADANGKPETNEKDPAGE